MNLENFLVLCLALGWVLHRHHALGLQLAAARVRARFDPSLPLLRQADRRLPW
ncbi:MAG: hypothetical protein HYY25_05730 [Candidatus Wallbacteria bacterium]|nr:hypothetical protein [Candidatus Wallbacteria bacterium]MBI4866170.1 hypothetical protein [Candidatus Wallbacteria bacterium]